MASTIFLLCNCQRPDIEETEEQIQKILETHHIELQEVMQEIEDKEEEYK